MNSSFSFGVKSSFHEYTSLYIFSILTTWWFEVWTYKMLSILVKIPGNCKPFLACQARFFQWLLNKFKICSRGEQISRDTTLKFCSLTHLPLPSPQMTSNSLSYRPVKRHTIKKVLCRQNVGSYIPVNRPQIHHVELTFWGFAISFSKGNTRTLANPSQTHFKIRGRLELG